MEMGNSKVFWTKAWTVKGAERADRKHRWNWGVGENYGNA